MFKEGIGDDNGGCDGVGYGGGDGDGDGDCSRDGNKCSNRGSGAYES